MGKRIEYKAGEIVGDHGVAYLRESRPYTRPCGRKERRATFKCVNCHSEFETQIQSVKYNHTTSCGCVHGGGGGGVYRRHGLYNHPLYDIWNSMIQRCYSENNAAYERYGAKGVEVWEEWRKNPQAFFDHILSLSNHNEDGYSLDRYPNNDGSYEPGNVQCATKHEQASNQRRAKNNTSGYVGVSFNKRIRKWVAYITIGGKTLYLKYSETPEESAMARDRYIIYNELFEYPLQILI